MESMREAIVETATEIQSKIESWGFRIEVEDSGHSQYVYVFGPDDDFVKIRVSDHDAGRVAGGDGQPSDWAIRVDRGQRPFENNTAHQITKRWLKDEIGRIDCG